MKKITIFLHFSLFPDRLKSLAILVKSLFCQILDFRHILFEVYLRIIKISKCIFSSTKSLTTVTCEFPRICIEKWVQFIFTICKYLPRNYVGGKALTSPVIFLTGGYAIQIFSSIPPLPIYIYADPWILEVSGVGWGVLLYKDFA